MRKSLAPFLVSAGLLAGSFPCQAVDPVSETENLLVTSLYNWRAGSASGALEQVKLLTAEQPNFKLAHLIYSDMLLTRAGKIGELSVNQRGKSTKLDNLLVEAQQRVGFYHNELNAASIKLPMSLLKMGNKYPRAVVVDVNSSRLYLFSNHNERLSMLRSYYVGIGKGGAYKQVEGDNKTPVGIYFNTGFIKDEELPDLYGAGALPINYPNFLDKKSGKTGSGIWIHGVPSQTYNRPPQSSRGCVTMANDDFKELKGLVDVGNTPILLVDKVQWVDAPQRETLTRSFVTTLEKWRSDWEQRNHDSYITHYHKDFRAMDMPLALWAEYKREVNAQKGFIKVGIDDISVFRDPHTETIVTEYRQNYQSDGFANQARKIMYWQKDASGEWKIVGEDITENIVTASGAAGGNNKGPVAGPLLKQQN